MHPTKALATLAATAGIASADFYIYIGGENYLIPGTTGGGPGISSQADVVYLFNEIPACDTPSSPSLYSPTNDIHESSSWACDGCTNYDDSGNITPTRFELVDYNAGEDGISADQRTLSGDGLGDVTLYPSPGVPGQFDIDYVRADGSSGVPGDQGYCYLTPTSSTDSWGPCSGPFEAGQAVQLFHCVSPLTALTT